MEQRTSGDCNRVLSQAQSSSKLWVSPTKTQSPWFSKLGESAKKKNHGISKHNVKLEQGQMSQCIKFQPHQTTRGLEETCCWQHWICEGSRDFPLLEIWTSTIQVLKNKLKHSCACFQDGAEFNLQNDSSPKQTVAFVFVFYVTDLSILNLKGKQAHSLGRKEDIRWWRGLKLWICWAVSPDACQGSYQTGTNTTSPREEKDQDQSGCWESWDGAAPLWKPERKGCKYPAPRAYMIIVYMIIPWVVKGGNV